MRPALCAMRSTSSSQKSRMPTCTMRATPARRITLSMIDACENVKPSYARADPRARRRAGRRGRGSARRTRGSRRTASRDRRRRRAAMLALSDGGASSRGRPLRSRSRRACSRARAPSRARRCLRRDRRPRSPLRPRRAPLRSTRASSLDSGSMRDAALVRLADLGVEQVDLHRRVEDRRAGPRSRPRGTTSSRPTAPARATTRASSGAYGRP